MKKRISKAAALLLAALFIIGSLPVSAAAQTAASTDYGYVSGTMYQTLTAKTVPDGISVSFASNLEALLSGDNTVFSQDLAVTAEIMSADIYQNVLVTTTGAPLTAASCQDDTSLPTAVFGLQDAEIVDLSQKTRDSDTDDITRFIISHKKVTENGKDREIIVVAVEGTNSTLAQWDSNFDVGADTDSYPGQHPEWLDHDDHKGFDVTYRRALAEIQNYIAEHVSASAAKTILITGHSRGGSIANLLGTYFEKQTDYRSFTYTFAAPAVTAKQDTSADTVFNIINTDDAIPCFPLASWGFRRYGTDITRDVPQMSAMWKSLTGIDYAICSGSQLETLTAAISATREGIYTFNTETSVCSSSASFATYQEAEAKIAVFETKLSSANIDPDYYRFVVEEGGTAAKPYTIACYVCPAFVMQYLAGLCSTDDYIGYMSKFSSVNLNRVKAYSNAVNFMVTDYLNNGLVHAHCSYGYYLAALNLQEAIVKTDYTGTKAASADITAGCASSVQVTLPEIPDGMSFGQPACASSEISGLAVKNGILTCSCSASAAVGDSFTITVPVNGGPSAAYNDYSVTVTLTAAACTHPSTEVRNAAAATYRAAGYTGDTYCSVCGTLLSSGRVIPKLTAPSGSSSGTGTSTSSGTGTSAAASAGTSSSAGTGASETTDPAAGTGTGAVSAFTDVSEGSYCYDAVAWAVEEGITSGKDPTHFDPSGTCTRAEAVTFLWRAAGCPSPASDTLSFTDVGENAWYREAVAWAVEAGITSGTSAENFSPNSPCTRGQIVTLLWRSRGTPAAAAASAFSDVAAGSYCCGAVAWAAEEGITSGTSAKDFSPDAPCTRGQIVTLLYRCLKD